MLLEAIARIQDDFQDWVLAVAGSDELGHAEELKGMASELGIENRVRFTGPIYGSAKRDAFAAADLFALPTRSENFGISIAEALGAGVPVLTTRGAPWSDLESCGCGWRAEISTESIAGALRDALRTDPAELAAMGRSGRDLVLNRYTWSRVAERTILLYRWLVEGGNPPSFVSLGS
jgi:glycosyltransferase involved in cell wall biosynthesis